MFRPIVRLPVDPREARFRRDPLVFAAGLEASEGPLGGDLGGAEALGGAFKGDAAGFLSRSGS